MDVLADMLAACRAGGALPGRTLLGPPFGVRYGEALRAGFHVLASGSAWLKLDGDDTDWIALEEGDVVFVPHGTPHVITDVPGRPTVDFRAHLAAPQPADPAATLICGSYPLDADGPSPLLAALPPVVRVSTGDSEAVRLTMSLLAAEADEAGVGSDLAVDRLVDLMLVHLLRVWLTQRPAQGGWLAALADPHVGRVLARLHADPGRRWTVAAMARESGLSRAAFARRFTELAGEPPLAYLTRWRMTVAARLLRDTRLPLAAIADQVGYDSEFAFARAFKRRRSTAPGRYRATFTAA